MTNVVHAPSAPAPAGDAERQLLAALAQQYVGTEFTARSAAAELVPALWQAAGVARPDPAAVGRWLRASRSASLTGKPDRSGVVRWRLRGATAPVAALRAPVPATSAPARPRASSSPGGRAGGPAAAPASLVASVRNDG